VLRNYHLRVNLRHHEVCVYRFAKYLIPSLLLAAAALISFVSAQDDGAVPGPKPYKFVLGPELKGEEAKNAVVKPAFKAVADDQFNYDVYFNVRRSGGTSQGGAGGFARSETWTALCNLLMEENELAGRKDLRAAFRYDALFFDLTDGDADYSGYVGPASGEGGERKAATFWKVGKDGTRTTAYAIPGWTGVSSNGVEGARSTQSVGANASAWFSVSGAGRVYDELYFAEYDSADQRSYPARLLDPVHIALGLMPEFAPDASVQLNGTTTVRRRMPMGSLPGATVDYELTYTLERVYGTQADPTCAQFKFSAKPVTSAQSTDLDAQWSIRFTAPEIVDGLLVYDLVKGVAAIVRYKYALKGELVGRGSGAPASNFVCEAEFSASLRKESKSK
jgi:hypothetical protein